MAGLWPVRKNLPLAAAGQSALGASPGRYFSDSPGRLGTGRGVPSLPSVRAVPSIGVFSGFNADMAERQSQGQRPAPLPKPHAAKRGEGPFHSGIAAQAIATFAGCGQTCGTKEFG